MKDSRELTDVRKELELLADEPYRVFHSRLLPGTENILGVRVPRLWKLARRLVKEEGADISAVPVMIRMKRLCCRGW